MKKLLSILLSLLLLAAALPSAAAAADMTFQDVPERAWYYADVKNAYETGLINGKSAERFAPDDDLTYAEAVKLAAAMNQLYRTGAVTLTNGSPWYRSYADYCLGAGIIDKDYEWNIPATRAGYMEIFAKALPAEAMAAINDVPDGAIPDVPADHPQSDAIYLLYRAGVLQGSTGMLDGVRTEHMCKPGDNIRRSEVAAILTRMMDADKRIRFDLPGPGDSAGGVQPTPAPLALELELSEAAVTVGESVTVSIASVSGGAEPYTVTWQTSGDGAIWADAEGTGESFTFTPAEPGTYYVRATVTDAAGGSATGDPCAVTVSAAALPLSADLPAAADTTVHAAVSLTAIVSGGTEPYAFAWLYQGPDDTGFTPADCDAVEYAPVFDAAGDWAVYCLVTDAEGRTAESGICAVTVESTLAVALPASAEACVGEPVEIAAEMTGGFDPCRCTWYYRQEADADYTEYASGASSFDKAFDAEGVWMVRCEVTDLYGQSAASFDCIVTVKPALRVSIPEACETPADVTVEIAATAEGGAAPYTFAWYLQEPSDSAWTLMPFTGDTFSGALSEAGTWEIYCEVKDAEGASASSDRCQISVSPAPLTVSIPAAAEGEVDAAMDVPSVVSGGTAPYEWAWYCKRAAEESFTPLAVYDETCAYAFDAAGVWELYCTVTDAEGRTADSGVCTVHVDMPLSVALPDSAAGETGVSVSITAALTGGKAPFTYQWYYKLLSDTLYSGSDAYGATFDPVFDAVGVWEIYCTVTDAGGDTADSNVCTLDVKEPTPPLIALVPSSLAGQTGDYINIPSTVSGGTEPYSYAWYCAKMGGGDWTDLGETDDDYDACFSEAGVWMCWVRVTDANGALSDSNMCYLTLNDPTPLVVSIPETAEGVIGETLSIPATVSGGTGPYTYKWYYEKAANPWWQPSGDADDTYNPTFTVDTVWQCCVTVTDAEGHTADSAICTITVRNSTPLSVSVPGLLYCPYDETVVIQATVSGGTGPYTYVWYGAKSGESTWYQRSGSSDSNYHYGASNGAWNYWVRVTDALGDTVDSAVCTVNVH